MCKIDIFGFLQVFLKELAALLNICDVYESLFSGHTSQSFI